MAGTSGGIVEQANAAKRLGDHFVPPVGAELRLDTGEVVRYPYEMVSRFEFAVWDIGRSDYFWLSVDRFFEIVRLTRPCPPLEKWYRPGNG